MDDVRDLRISVVIATYQRADLLSRPLQSLQRQTLADFEVVVVDDGSTDHTADLVGSWGDPRVRLVQQANQGRSSARNRGAREARAEIVVFLDSDDEVEPNWLESLVAGFDNPAIAIVCCGVRLRFHKRQKGKDDGVRLPRSLGPVYGGVTGLFLTGTAAMRRDVFLAVGGYEESLSHGENTELAHRLVDHCLTHGLSIGAVPAPLLTFHHSRSAPTMSGFEARLHSALTILARHGHKYRRSPRSYARYCSMAGVNLARLGRLGEARPWFVAAVRAWPRDVQHWGRVLYSLVPPVARRHWAVRTTTG
jgi:GT2 family glycosyltransferase